MSETTDKVSGKAKEMAGKATGNRKQELKGKAQHKTADMRHQAKDAVDDVASKLQR